MRDPEEFVPKRADQKVNIFMLPGQEHIVLPDRGMRHKSQPCLEDEGDYACPVEEQAASEMRLHVLPLDVIYNEWKSMQKRKDKEGVSNPPVKYLKPLM